jgi:hypothetical protein
MNAHETIRTGGLHVEQIWRFPVKSMRGEQLGAATLTDDGIVGDPVEVVDEYLEPPPRGGWIVGAPYAVP